MRSDEPAFTGVLADARRGDPAAWSELYHAVAPLVLGYLRAQHLDDPEDVGGQVMLEVVNGIDRFSGTSEQFRSWVLTIAHHRTVDRRRHDARRPLVSSSIESLEPHPAADDPAADAVAALGLDDLERHLATLTVEQRAVILLRVVGDRSLKETAAIMGKRVNAVKALQHRAVAALRRRLAAGQHGALTAPGRNPRPSDDADEGA